MPDSEHKHDRWPPESFEQLRHDLLNPLATIRGRAQLLTRAVERSTGIENDERVRLLRGLAAIDQAVFTAVEVLDHADPQPDGDENTTER